MVTVFASAFAAATAHADVLPPPPMRNLGHIEIVVPVAPQDSGDGRPVLVPATIEYEWMFRVPVLSIKPRRFTVTVVDTSTRWKHWEYEAPGLRSKRIKLWDIPEFSCKYADLILPNDCRTVWHGVYVDVPVLVSERGHVDVEVPQARIKEQSFVIDVARWTWTDKRFRFSIPALAPAESVERARFSLNGQRVEVAAASDEAIAAIDRELEAIQAGGGDPSRLVAEDGSAIDLPAQRQSLIDERARELDRLAAIGDELSLLPARR